MWSLLRIMVTNHLATTKWSLLRILDVKCLVVAKPFLAKILVGKFLMAEKWLSSGILPTNCLVSTWKFLPIFWLGNKFWKKWIWRSKFLWFPCVKLKGCWKDLIWNLSFISLIFPCVYYWLGRIWLTNSCLAALLIFRILAKINRWRLVSEHTKMHHLFRYMVHVEWRIIWWLQLKLCMRPLKNKSYFAQLQ